jgi:hypothetical protein
MRASFLQNFSIDLFYNCKNNKLTAVKGTHLQLKGTNLQLQKAQIYNFKRYVFTTVKDTHLRL